MNSDFNENLSLAENNKIDEYTINHLTNQTS